MNVTVTYNKKANKNVETFYDVEKAIIRDNRLDLFLQSNLSIKTILTKNIFCIDYYPDDITSGGKLSTWSPNSNTDYIEIKECKNEKKKNY